MEETPVVVSIDDINEEAVEELTDGKCEDAEVRNGD